MKTLGVHANCSKSRAPEVLRRLEARAAELGLQLIACDQTAQLLPRAEVSTFDEICARVDALVVLGGDGSMLRAARLLKGSGVPLIGINIGSLGFLTSVAEKDIDRALTCLQNDDFTTSVRAAIECSVIKNNTVTATYLALNDIVVHCGEALRVVTLDVAIDGETVTSYICDGLVIATPTGSTGHSLSAGGPILHPASQAWIITAICPHALGVRPLVNPDTSTIEVRIVESADALRLSVDGQEGESLACGDGIKVQRSAEEIRFIHLPGYSHFAVLRQKLHWRGAS